MKIIYCIPGTSNSGGIERIVMTKASWAAEHGHEVMIVTTEQKKNSKNFYELHPSIKRIDLELFYTEDSRGNIIKNYFRRQKKYKAHKRLLKGIIEKESPDIVVSSFNREEKFLYKLKDKSGKILEFHFCRNFRNIEKSGWLRSLYYRYITRKDRQTVSKYDRFVCLTHEDKANWGNLKNMEVIPNFLSIQPGSPSALDQKKVLTVGRLEYQKGLDRLIEAWKDVSRKHPDWSLEIYGEGSLETELKNLIKSYGLENSVRINKPTSGIAEIYGQHSCLVISSRYEGFPLVLIEGMAYGLPIVSYDCPCGPKDTITTGYNGILVTNGDIKGLADAIGKVIEDEDLRHTLGRNGFKESKKYTIDEIMQRWIALFEEVKKEK